MGRIRKTLTAFVVIVVMLAAASAVMSYMINRSMIRHGAEYTATLQTAEKIKISQKERDRIEELGPECAIVLGAGIYDTETPTMMLKDRLDLAVYLYRHKLVPKLLLTGDNGQVQHNEIHVMLKYCLDAGIPPEDIFCDHAGFSTYESMYRADYIFHVKRAVVVTQNYHLSRALWLADGFGIEALGAASDQQQPYPGQLPRNQREVLARVKDYFMLMARPKPKYLGEAFPVTDGSGEATHGE